jgi:hypothetical protein
MTTHSILHQLLTIPTLTQADNQLQTHVRRELKTWLRTRPQTMSSVTEQVLREFDWKGQLKAVVRLSGDEPRLTKLEAYEYKMWLILWFASMCPDYAEHLMQGESDNKKEWLIRELREMIHIRRAGLAFTYTPQPWHADESAGGGGEGAEELPMRVIAPWQFHASRFVQHVSDLWAQW